jgi:2-polyprenyl-3-methyl-5-hydroxy-6-metoxy-1,4-benzoquinol methylase
MNGMHGFSPLQTDYAEKYQDRPRLDVMGLLEFPFRSVLEIGCGCGATGQAVKQKFPGVTYYGVELDPSAAASARTLLDRVITGNIEEIDLEHYDIRRNMFDVILCADVLEHLYDPWNIVGTFHRYLRPEGRVIASIPNVQNVRLLHNLVGGRWTYSSQGLLDATHIRFFTLHEIGQMFIRNGYAVEQVISNCDNGMPTSGPWPRDVDLGRMVVKQVTAEDIRQLYTFQYLIRVRKTATQGGAS